MTDGGDGVWFCDGVVSSWHLLRDGVRFAMASHSQWSFRDGLHFTMAFVWQMAFVGVLTWRRVRGFCTLLAFANPRRVLISMGRR